MADYLDGALKKMPRYESNLSRSVYFGDTQKAKEYMSRFKTGESVSFEEYISTTRGAELYNPEGEIQIYIQDAKNGRDISLLNTAESEVLYERNSRFCVLNIVEQDGQYYILMEEG